MYPPVINDEKLYKKFLESMKDMNCVEYEPLAIAEDFCLLSTRSTRTLFIFC